MAIRIVAIAAVRIRRVAVALDDARARRRTREARRSRSKALRRARSHVVREPRAVVRVAHEDGGFDGCERVPRERGPGAAAERVVHDLAALEGDVSGALGWEYVWGKRTWE